MPTSTLRKLGQLSGPHCVLLAAQYATQSNITALRALTALRDADLPLELTLSILLTCLPEKLKPADYVPYLHGLGADSRDPGDDATSALDISSVEQLSAAQARKRQRALHLLPVTHPLYAAEDQLDAFSHFLIHRAHRIDAQTGLLDLVPDLVVPFLAHSEYLRTWFISTILPLLRLGYQDYPQHATMSLDEFAQLEGKKAIDFQLSHTQHMGSAHVVRDIKGIVAPWLCGANDRKRRKLSERSEDVDDWTCLFQWIVQTSQQNLQLASTAINEWDGPEDMDLGGFEEGRDYVDDEQQRQLEMQYAQTALACFYLIHADDIKALQTAHSLLRRVCDLLNYDAPPDLNIGVEQLPLYNLHETLLHKPSPLLIQQHRVLDPDNALTKPSRASIHLLELILFSACTLSSLQHPVPLKELAQVCLRRDHSEQLTLFQKVLHTLCSAKRDSEQWANARLKLVWLWSWGSLGQDTHPYAPGVFGMLERATLESQLLEAFLDGSHYPLAIQTYLGPPTGQHPIPLDAVETTLLKSAMHHYDNASNGNRARGGMRRADEIIAAFAPHFPHSPRFWRAQALIAATHAMSFYSLTLEHGVPFQPVNIRVSSNPLSLIQKLLSQNHESYTRLDDLISIGQNLVVSMPSTIMDSQEATSSDSTALEEKKAMAERCVIGMAVNAALDEHDFETAYSYAASRLTPWATGSIPPPQFSYGVVDTEEHEDAVENVPWQATLRAGRYIPTQKRSNAWWSYAPRPDLRWMEQRMELLAQALMLAPSAHLEAVLSEWRRCEGEHLAMLAEEEEAEARFDDVADLKLPGSFFSDMLTTQPQREVSVAEEAPMDLFSMARGVASAVSKSAFPLRGSAGTPKTAPQEDSGSSRVSVDMGDSGSMSHEDRIRKRDMMANVATGALASGTGALASGLGWMLGAKPVHEPDRQ